MRFLSRIVWSEGMYLSPHHFQAQSRYFEDTIRFATENLWFEAYGLLGFQLDAQALRNGTVSLQHARGIFPDGLSFEMPECDALPAAREIREVFPPTMDSLVVSLAVPARAANGPNCELDSEAEAATRFVANVKTLHDENTGSDEKPVYLGRKNVRLLLETETAEDVVTMPIARVLRSGSGQFVYDPEFVPPVLRLSASERLMYLTKRLIEILDEKSATLSASKKKTTKFVAGMSSGDVASFWFLHTIHSALSALRHMYQSKRGHPEEVYREMARLGGALCTFGLDVHPKQLPAYDHQHLGDCFTALDTHIRRHLEIVVPMQAIPIVLKPVAPYVYEGDVVDQRCLDRARWIFGIHASTGAAETIIKTPQVVKICSSKFISELVKRALPGLQLTHMSVPPSSISARVETEYFNINRTGPCWEHIVLTRKVGVYVPGDLPAPEMELLVVLES